MLFRNIFIFLCFVIGTAQTLDASDNDQRAPQKRSFFPGKTEKQNPVITKQNQPTVNTPQSPPPFRQKRDFTSDISFATLNKMKMGEPSPVILLSIDGAAVRGPYQLKILRAISQRLGKPIHEIFDLFTGTSAGATNVAGLTTPAQDQIGLTNTGVQGLRARYPIDTLLQFGDQIISETFDKNKIRKLRVLGGLLGSQFSSKPMAEILQHVTAGTNMADTLKPVIITSHDFLDRETYLFSTRKACENPIHDRPLWEAALASGSAPVYFKTVPVNIGGKEMALGDAGLYIMNPSLLGYVEARILFPDRKIYIVSISSGDLVPKVKRRNMRIKGNTAGNIPTVLQGTIESCLEGQQFATNEMVNEMKMFPEIVGYKRLGFRVENNDFSDTSAKNKALLDQAVEETIRSQEFEDLIRDLQTILARRSDQNDAPVYKCPLKMPRGFNTLRKMTPQQQRRPNQPY